jgi:predicted acylesterase/phospholipase RssA
VRTFASRHFGGLVLFSTVAVILCGCSSAKRPAKTPEELAAMHEKAAELSRASGRAVLEGLVDHVKAEYDEYLAHKRPNPPVIDILIISGGGDWGAFGAGFLKGWGTVNKSDALARPEFTAVTGVSTGALISPFAFLGDEDSINRIVNLYRNPKPDWVKQRGFLYFLPNNISFAEVPGLERELRANVSQDMIKSIADKGATGRFLAVNTTNVDDGEPRVFDLVAESKRAVETGHYDRFQDILLASSGIAGAFPFRIIDDEMYVDGGITGNIIYGGRLGEEQTVPAVWQRKYPEIPIPKTRFWVIFNNQVRPQPQVTEPRWPTVVTRSLEMATRASTLTALRHLYAMAEISRLKRHADVEVRVVAIPTSWKPPVAGVFVKETMNNLADLGEKMGADTSSWSTESPP